MSATNNTTTPNFFTMQNFILFLFILFFPIHGSAEFDPYRLCSNATFSPNSTYFSNLNLLSSALSSNSSHKFYYNTSAGRQSDHRAYGHFQCRGDINASACQNCVAMATFNASQQFCPLSTKAVIWFDECLLRYSNKSFFSVVDKQNGLILINNDEIEEGLDRFNQLVVSTLTGAATRAANASSEGTLMFATEEAGFRNETIYSLAQCTGDLSRSSCDECLKAAVKNFPSCCDGKKGGRVLLPSCTVRYELYAFYNGVRASSPVSTPTPAPEPGRGSVPATPSVPSSSASSPAPSPVAPSLSGNGRTRVVMAIGVIAATLLS